MFYMCKVTKGQHDYVGVLCKPSDANDTVNKTSKDKEVTQLHRFDQSCEITKLHEEAF